MNKVLKKVTAVQGISHSNKLIYLISYTLFILILQGPIYWVPFIDVNLWNIFKDLIILSFVYLVLIRNLTTRNLFSYIVLTKEGKILSLLIISIISGVILSSNFYDSMLLWIRFLFSILLVSSLFSFLRINRKIIPSIEIIILIPVIISSIYIILCASKIIPFLLPPRSYIIDWAAPYNMGFCYRRNAMSWAIAYAFPISFFHLIEKLKRSSYNLRLYLLIIINVILIIAMLITNSRGGIVGVIFSVIIGILLYKFETKRKIFFTLIIFFLVLILFFSITSSSLSKRFNLLLRREDDISNKIDFNRLTSGRIDIYKIAYTKAKDNPFFGIGLGQFKNISKKSIIGAKKSAHNLFLGLAVETGIISSIIALIFVLFTFFRWSIYIFRNRTTLSYHFFILYCIMIVGIFSTFVESGTMFFNIHIGIPFWFSLAGLEILQYSFKDYKEKKKYV